jgi:hypothetical protein
MWYNCRKSTQNKGELLMKKINKLQNFFAIATFVAALMACGVSLAASSTFTAATDDDNNGYNGTVTAGGDGYAFTAEDSARYYKFLYLNDDLLLDGAVCAGSTNWYTAYIGTYAWHPVTVTVTNGARMVTQRSRDIVFRGKGGTIVVSEPTDAPYTWAAGSYSTTVLGDKTLANIIGTVGYSSKFTLCSDVTSDTGTNDILRLLDHGTASMLFVSNQNANVAARILFEGGELRSLEDGAKKFQVADGAKIILQSVDGNPIRLRTRPWDYSLFSGAGTLETAGDGDFVLLQHTDSAFTVTLGTDEGGRIIWGHTGDLKLGGRMRLKLTSDDVLPHGEGKGKVMIAVGEYSGTKTTEATPLVIDLNGTANTVNAIAIGGDSGYSKWHVITNSSETVATLGLDIWNTESEQRLHELMRDNVKLAANASSTIKFKKLGAAKLMVIDPQATNVLESVAGTEVADGVLWFGDSYTLTRPLMVSGSGSIQVREDVQWTARTLNLSAIDDADLSIGGLTVDTKYYYGKTPTITKFRPAANGKLYLTNVSGELPASYTVPINLTTVVDAENFASWKVYVNGAEARGYVPVYENGVLKAKRKHGLAIFVR